jgi:hypothetical protein
MQNYESEDSMRLHIVRSAVMSAALLSGLHGQEKPVIELSWSAPHIEPVLSPYTADETPDGYIFRGPGAVNYQIHIAKISPRLAVHITRKGDKYRYDIALENGRAAKDPIRDVTFSYNSRDIPEHPAYTEQRAPNGWTIFDNTFRGELKPNRIASFSLVTALAPDDTMLVISGIDHQARTADRFRLIQEGVSSGIFRFMAQTLRYREYVVYHLNDPRYGGVR